VDFIFPKKIFLSPQATSCIPEVLLESWVDFIFPKKIFLRPQETSCIPEVLRDPRADFIFPVEIFSWTLWTPCSSVALINLRQYNSICITAIMIVGNYCRTVGKKFVEILLIAIA
jgi:hypothetical protein